MKIIPKKYAFLIAGIMILVFIIIVTGLFGADNNYKTPIKTMQKYDNTKKYYSEDQKTAEMLNGFCEKEMKQIYKLYKSTKNHKQSVENSKKDFNQQINDTKKVYGSNYEYTYNIKAAQKLSENELKEQQKDLRNYSNSLANKVNSTKGFDNADWENYAEELGLEGNAGAAQKFIKNYSIISEKMSCAKVTDGYKLKISVTLTGSKINKKETNENYINVYKIDGRWVTSNVTSLDYF